MSEQYFTQNSGSPIQANAIQQGFLLTRHSHDNKNRHTTQIILWLSTDQGPAKLIIEGEQPLFFAKLDDIDAINNVLKGHDIIHSVKPLTLKTFQHEQVLGLYFDSMHGFYHAKELLQAAHIQLFESDFRLQERFLMERFICGGLSFVGKPIKRPKFIEYQQAKVRPSDYQPQLAVISLDIECSIKGDLYSIGLYGKKDTRYYQKVIMIGPYQDPKSPIEPSDQATAALIEWVTDEPELLQALENSFLEFDPDVIIGWNVVNFDFKLLLERAKLNKLKLRLGRGGAIANWRDSQTDLNQGFIRMPGRVVIDGIDALKTATYNFPSFSLEHVAQELLGKGKQSDDVHNRAEEISQDFIHNKVKLASYNLNDCILVWDIFNHTQVLQFLVLRAQLTGLKLDRQGGSVAAFTNLYLPKLHRAGYIAPNLPVGGGLASPGGYVMNSKPGLYEHVLVLDFKSLYPSIIRTFKIDPLGLIEGLAAPDNAIPGFKQAMFSREHHFLPEIITQLWQQRDQAKKDNDAPSSQAIKILMNSFYGVLGSGGCRFYDTRLASSITLRGHDIMQTTAEWIKAHGYEVIYGDTDSTFVWLNQNITNEQANAIGKSLAADINQKWQQKLQQEFNLACYLELEFETHFKRFLMPTIRGSEIGSKKRYAGLIETTPGDRQGDKLIFKGLENVRTDWTTLAKSFQAKLFECVFYRQNPSDYIQQIVNDTKHGKLDDQLVYRKRLRRRLDQYVKNVPPHVKAARIADEHNKALGLPLQYQHKGWITYVITVNGPEPIEYQRSPIDYDHYIEKQLQPVADAILPFIDLNFDSLVNQQIGLF